MTERPGDPAVPPEQGLDANAVYSLGSSDSETARLQRQPDQLRPDNSALLDRVGLRPGPSAIDLGCGPRGILDLLAERVSPGAGSSVSTPTLRSSPWPPSSPPRAGAA